MVVVVVVVMVVVVMMMVMDGDDDDDDRAPAHLLNLSFSASDRGCHWHVPEKSQLDLH